MTILVAEDDEFLREIVALNLIKRGFHVLTAAEGREAFQVIQENPMVELVISDIQMPGGNGMDLLQNIQTLNTKAPKVILMTGYADVTLKEAVDAGANAVIAKPFQTEALLQLINGLFPTLNFGK